jgi:diguanylate cyclase (GGDEF)-like protein
MNDDVKKEDLVKQVSELEREIHELEKNLIHDPLTGLKTRAFLEDEAKTYLESIRSAGKHNRKEWFGFKNISFLFFDIDYFKKINDTFGHDTGDIVLKKVTETIAGSLRGGDTAARWGGEEIVVSLLGANEADAYDTALRIKERVEGLSFQENPDLKVTISCGVATAEEGISLEKLLKRADDALYEAKKSGRNKVIRYSELKNR